MYIGPSTDAMPTPIPPIMRATIKTENVGGIALNRAETKNNIAATIRFGFRPKRSPNQPATAAPTMHPTRAALVNQPSWSSVKPNW